MTKRTLPTDYTYKPSGLEQDVEIKPDGGETEKDQYTHSIPPTIHEQLEEICKQGRYDQLPFIMREAADIIDRQAEQIKELRENAAFYCPTCKRHAHTIDKDGFHKCHTKVVPMWSEERRKVYRLEDRLLAIEKALKGGA